MDGRCLTVKVPGRFLRYARSQKPIQLSASGENSKEQAEVVLFVQQFCLFISIRSYTEHHILPADGFRGRPEITKTENLCTIAILLTTSS